MKAPRLSVAFISAGALAYEVLLIRLFSIIQWHHFAYMIISLALLGYGASGTFLSLSYERLSQHFRSAYLLNLLLFAFTSVACFLLVQQLPFNPQELLWDGRQPLWLFLIYLILALPFFFAANCVGMALMQFNGEVSRVYAADLLGAAVGSIGIIGLLFLVFPDRALLVLGSLIALAAIVAVLELNDRSKKTIGLIAVLVVLPWLLPTSWTKPQLSPYKGLSQLLQVSGTQVVQERSSPLGLLSVVESENIPLRHAPGLSLMATRTPPEQLALFTDGDGMTSINRAVSDNSRLAYLDAMPSALPYHLKRPERVLVLGAGGGSDILQARFHQVAHIDAVELNPQLVDLINNDYAGFAGKLFDAPDTKIHISEARGFVSSTDQDYDLIQIALMDSFSASSAGLYALSESYLYTVEAFEEYLSHLKPEGYLAISRWVKLPPQDALKLFATAVQALRQMGVEEPAQRLALIRSWQTSTLLIKNGAFTQAEIAALKSFSDQRAFDTAYYPGIVKEEASRFNKLRQDYFYQGTQALLGDNADAFIKDYKFDLQPATDDRPYFFNFFKWSVLPEILKLKGQGGTPLLGMGYLILAATLVQALIASLVLIILPLLFGSRGVAKEISPTLKLRGLGYFFALGLAFLFVEIAFIQKFILFLHHPLYAVSVVLASFLLFAGLGSAYANRFQLNHQTTRVIRVAVGFIIVLGLSYTVIIGPLLNNLMGLPEIARILISAALIAPLAFFMGMPFPMGLARLSEKAPAMIPWVWGVNGCASVISAILATILAIHLGFTVVIVLALGLYFVAAVLRP